MILDFLQCNPLCFRYEFITPEYCQYTNGSIKPEGSCSWNGIDKLQESKGYDAIEQPVGKGADAEGVIEGTVAVLYGDFITNVIDFIIVAFVMFLVVKAVNKTKKQEEEAPAIPSLTSVPE